MSCPNCENGSGFTRRLGRDNDEIVEGCTNHLPDPPPCRACECNHDGSVPGFAPGECYCGRIGGPWIQSRYHEYEPPQE